MDCSETHPIEEILTTTDTVPMTPARLSHDPIAELVQQALYRQQAVLHVKERRREQRHAYPYPVYLTPLNHEGRADIAETFVVIGKHLSYHGFDFYHCEPVPYRRVLASLDCGGGRWAGFILDLGWCRFNRNGWYDNGGRFLEIADSPFNQRNLPEDHIRGRGRKNDEAADAVLSEEVA